MALRFMHIVAGGSRLYLCTVDKYAVVWIDHNSFIHSPGDALL